MKIKDNGKEINIRDSITKIIPEGDNNPITITPYVNNETERSVQLSFKDSYLFDNILSDTLDIEKNNEKISINTKDSGSIGGTNISGVDIYYLSTDDLNNPNEVNKCIEKVINNESNEILTILQFGMAWFYPVYSTSRKIYVISLVEKSHRYYFLVGSLVKDKKAVIEYYNPTFISISDYEYDDYL